MSIEKELRILTIVSEDRIAKFKELEEEWSKYFYFTQVFDTPNNLKNHLKEKIDILFLDSKYNQEFNFDYYRIFQESEPVFWYVAVTDLPRPEDVELYKNLADNILYLNNFKEVVKWKTIATLRRFWNTASKPTTVIHKELIIDFVSRVVLVNGKAVILSPKEFDVLKMLSSKKGQFIEKTLIIREVWGFDDEDYSRVLDQILFKIKKKIGSTYISAKRSGGVKFV